MKLFYTPVERMLLATDDPRTVALNHFLWNSAWEIYSRLDGKGSRLSKKEARLASHIAGLLQI